MGDNEDYLDGLLDSISQVKTKDKPRGRKSRDRRASKRGRRRSVSADEDFMEATGLDEYDSGSRRRGSSEDDFLADFEDELSKDMADDLISSFERELDGGDYKENFSSEDDYFDTASDDGDFSDIDDAAVTSEDDGGEASGAKNILNSIAGIVSEAKRVASSPDEEEEEPDLSAEADTAAEVPDSGALDLSAEEEPDLSTGMGEEPILDESGDGVDLMSMLEGEEGDTDLADINELLSADEEGNELDDARDAFEEAAEDAAEGGEGAEGAEAAEDGEGGSGEGSGGAEGSSSEEGEEGEEEKKPSLIQKILGIFKKKESDEDDEEDEEEEEEEGEGGETAEEKKARKKAEKEEKAKKKKEEAEAKKKAKAEEKKAKEAEKKAKAAAKAAKPKKPKKKKVKERSPKIPVPVFIVFTLLGVSIIASINIMTGVISYRTIVGKAKRAYDKKDYTVAYRIVAGNSDLSEEDQEFRSRAKMMSFLQLKGEQYRIFMNSGTMTETGVDNYNIRTNYQMALDSLIQGVYYFKKNEAKANELGITEEYSELGADLERELSNQFGMTSGDAVDLYHKENRKDYTVAIQEKIKENGLTEKK